MTKLFRRFILCHLPQQIPTLFVCVLYLDINNFVYADEITQANFPNSFQKCIVCHGKNAQGNNTLKSPVLAGQYDWYLQRQLNNFTNGLRGKHPQDNGGQQMAAIAKTLSSAEISLLSDYLSKLPIMKDENFNVESTGDFKNGSRYYQAKCGACHGGKAQGNKSFNAPKLANQTFQYLAQQMENFQQGKRGTEKADKFDRQMAMMSKTVQPKQLNDILFYISKQNIDIEK